MFCLFRLFWYRSETPKQTEKKFVVLRKNKPKNKTDRVSVCFGWNREKKINSFDDPLIEKFFWRFFWFVSTKFCLFWLFRYRSETLKQTEKMFFGFANKPKNNQNRMSFSLFQFEPKKKIWLFQGHPTANRNRKRKFAFLGLQTINRKRCLLF